MKFRFQRTSVKFGRDCSLCNAGFGLSVIKHRVMATIKDSVHDIPRCKGKFNLGMRILGTYVE